MIKIYINENEIRIKGHANYNEFGKDIVCASVSTVIYTTINYIMNIDKNSIEYTDNSNVITITKINSNEVVDILLNTMIEILKDLENQYKENIKIESEE